MCMYVYGHCMYMHARVIILMHNSFNTAAVIDKVRVASMPIDLWLLTDID